MEIFGIGLPEMAFILLIALILLGPKDMVAAGKTIGRLLRRIVMSDTWRAMRRTGEEFQKLPTTLMREAGLEEDLKDLKNLEKDLRNPKILPPDFKKAFHNPVASDDSPPSPPTSTEPSTPETPPQAPASPEEKPDSDED